MGLERTLLCQSNLTWDKGKSKEREKKKNDLSTRIRTKYKQLQKKIYDELMDKNGTIVES